MHRPDAKANKKMQREQADLGHPDPKAKVLVHRAPDDLPAGRNQFLMISLFCQCRRTLA